MSKASPKLVTSQSSRPKTTNSSEKNNAVMKVGTSKKKK